MRLSNFETIILSADPTATHYAGVGNEKYTVWAEHGGSNLNGNEVQQDKAWRIQVDRYTKLENDPVVSAIDAALDRDEIASNYLVDVEMENGVILNIHHIWDCEVA